MALVKTFINHPVVELTRIQAVKDGHHFTQYKMAEGITELENGMLVIADHVAGTVGKASDITEKVYLHASVEHVYNGEGRDQFVVKAGEMLPRIYELKDGDKFETNAVVFTDTASTGFAPAGTIKTIFGTVATMLESGKVYATVCVTAGGEAYVELLKDKPTANLVLEVEKVVTLPNNTRGFKFVVTK